MSSTADDIRAAIQALLDEHSDGWSLGQFVIAMGLERVTSDSGLDVLSHEVGYTSRKDVIYGHLFEPLR